jgi:L-lactate dehydrogenase complex protein LldF
MPTHATRAAHFLADEPRTDWHDESLWHVRSKRDGIISSIKDWEALRQLGSDIKDNVLSNLDSYLDAFAAKAEENGVVVHWARDATEHNEIVHGILKRHAIDRIVKSKSMLTEECHLNQYLEERGVEVVDTDLGERIIQLRGEPPSHIVMPAIHLKKEEIGALFHEKLGTDAGASDPQYLTEAARQHLREKFLAARAAITGVNFGVAETGGVVVCTNEGNADMGVHLAPVQIHCMGIEKVIPRAEHLGVFTRLLGRSATGQPITIYTSHHHRPKPGGEMHIVIVDNGRTEQLGREDFRNSLKCIRCGACMNTCPIYRRSGGHSYDHTIPGPIGSILSPGLDLKKHGDLAFASTLCGSCSDVCPVKIDIHAQLYKWRQVVSEEGHLAPSKRLPLLGAGAVLSRNGAYDLMGKAARVALKIAPRAAVYNRFNDWGQSRELPEVPQQSFKEWYADRKTGKNE